MYFFYKVEDETLVKKVEQMIKALTEKEQKKLANKIIKDIGDAYHWHMLKEDRRNGKI